ncbi:MAG: ribosome small subunit-dependent GTPase A [Anaerolineales bacterium]
MENIRGLVVRAQSGFYGVETPQGLILAKLRGRLKQGRATGDIVALGDRVEVSIQGGDEPMIEAVEPRLRSLVRRDPRPQGEYEQVIVANLDQALFIFSCADPAPKFRMLDRFLVIAEAQAIPAVVIANKIDLVGQEEAQRLFGHYTTIGYRLIYSSAKTGEGTEALQQIMSGKLSVLAGPSGAGKSSLMNVVQPALDLRVGAVQEGSRKGTHTTVERLLHKLDGGGYVADTPGLKALALWDIQPEELDGYFPEFRRLLGSCKYGDCAHLGEPSCAVKAAVEKGEVTAQRYQSYKQLREGQED